MTHPSPHIEIWGHFVATHRFFKRVTTGAIVLAFVGLALGSYGVLAAHYYPLVYYVEPDGRASPGGRLRQAHVPLEVEVKYVAKRFIRLTVGVSSLRVEADFVEAWNLMTDALQDEHDRELAAYAKERGHSFLDYIRDQQIRTEVEVTSLEVMENDGDLWTVQMQGTARTWPLSVVGEEAGYQDKEWSAAVTLVSVPRTEETPNGLLVAGRTLRFFQAKSEAQGQEEAVPAGPPAGDPAP